ncbi:MAG: hypothetical protein WD894_20515 [Pirellulales bacterium]
MNRFVVAALFIILVVGAVLRAYRLDTPRFNNDEAFAWRLAIKPLPELLITAAGDTTPPAHYLALKVWMHLWGTSAIALRALSVLCGALLIVAVYGVVVEAARWGNVSRSAAGFGGFTAALLTAVHSFQLTPNRTARMYGLGALLAVVSMWLLLRALRADRRRESASPSPRIDRPYAWWTAYGVCAALYLLTHHFALFTLAGQGLFALWCAFAPRASFTTYNSRFTVTSRSEQGYLRRSILLAGAIALLIYSPWLPAGIAQTSRVSEDFWVEAPTLDDWGHAFVRWCVGIDRADTTWITVCVAGAVLVVARTLWVRHRSHHAPRDVSSRGARGLPSDVSSRGARGLRCCNAAAIALLGQAALPWIAIVLMATVGDRPMLQDRYLAFSQVSWLALLGVVVASIARPESRVAVAVSVIGVTLLGTQQFVAELPPGPSGIVAASERLARDYLSGGVVVVQRPPDVNCLKFQLRQHGATDVDIRAVLRPWPTSGHINHVASLDSGEFLSRIEDLPAEVPQLWFAGTPDKFPGGGNLPGWQWIEEITYKGHGEQAPDYILRRYERPDGAPAVPIP